MPLFRRAHVLTCLTLLLIIAAALPMFAQNAQPEPRGGEVNLVVPALGQATFLNINGRVLLTAGLLIPLSRLQPLFFDTENFQGVSG